MNLFTIIVCHCHSRLYGLAHVLLFVCKSNFVVLQRQCTKFDCEGINLVVSLVTCASIFACASTVLSVRVRMQSCRPQAPVFMFVVQSYSILSSVAQYHALGNVFLSSIVTTTLQVIPFFSQWSCTRPWAAIVHLLVSLVGDVFVTTGNPLLIMCEYPTACAVLIALEPQVVWSLLSTTS